MAARSARQCGSIPDELGLRETVIRSLKKHMTGFRPAIYAREGLMLGVRQPLDGPVFEKLEHAEQWCIDVMIDHYDRRLGMSGCVD